MEDSEKHLKESSEKVEQLQSKFYSISYYVSHWPVKIRYKFGFHIMLLVITSPSNLKGYETCCFGAHPIGIMLSCLQDIS